MDENTRHLREALAKIAAVASAVVHGGTSPDNESDAAQASEHPMGVSLERRRALA